MELTEITREFRAMNTQVNAAVCAPPSDREQAAAALAGVESVFRDAEARFSRFLPESELSALNDNAGRPFGVSAELYDIVAAAVDYAGQTGGRFDPAVLPDLVAAGYDRSFETLSGTYRLAMVLPHPGWQQIRLDPAARTVTLPEDGMLDLGGIGKGWTADRAAATLKMFPGFIIDAGGDIVTGGTGTDGNPWEIGIADPFDDTRDLAVISVTDGAVCTSSTRKRRWGAGAHHIIDPRTGRPAHSGVAAATVRAKDAATAEVLAKAAVVAGPDEALALVSTRPATGVFLVLEDGTTRYSHGFAFA